MTFIIGNKMWEFRNKHGRDYKYTPDEFWEVALEYFAWVEDNPLLEEQLFAYQGSVIRESVSKMRAMTIDGFTLFADIGHTTWNNYQKNDDFMVVITRIEKSIREQKFTGASANLLNPNIIARDLGLSDKQDHSSSDGSMATKEINISLPDGSGINLGKYKKGDKTDTT